MGCGSCPGGTTVSRCGGEIGSGGGAACGCRGSLCRGPYCAVVVLRATVRGWSR